MGYLDAPMGALAPLAQWTPEDDVLLKNAVEVIQTPPPARVSVFCFGFITLEFFQGAVRMAWLCLMALRFCVLLLWTMI